MTDGEVMKKDSLTKGGDFGTPPMPKIPNLPRPKMPRLPSIPHFPIPKKRDEV